MGTQNQTYTESMASEHKVSIQQWSDTRATRDGKGTHGQGVLLGDPHITALLPVGRCLPSHPQGQALGPVCLPESCPGLAGAQGCFLA